MNIDSIKNGLVIDHIHAGGAMRLYNLLGLDELDCTVAIIKNAQSGKLGRKDIIKIDTVTDIDLDVLGYVDPGITVNVIRGGELVEKKQLSLPERLENVLRCRKPPLHNLRGAGAQAGILPLRPQERDLPLHLLRGQGGEIAPGVFCPNSLPAGGACSIINVSKSRGDGNGTSTQGL